MVGTSWIPLKSIRQSEEVWINTYTNDTNKSKLREKFINENIKAVPFHLLLV